MDRTGPASTTTTTIPKSTADTPKASSKASAEAKARAAPITAKRSPARRRIRRRFQTDPAPAAEVSHQSLGPLRRGAPGTEPPTKPGPASTSASEASGSLRDQGVVGLQLRHQGDTAEVRLQLRQGEGTVEALFRETARGVEIQLSAGPDQQALLRRVAETLANQRRDQAFDLDEINVDVDVNPHGHPRQSQRQAPEGASGDEGPGLNLRRRRQAVGRTGSAAHPVAAAMGTHYSR